MEIGKVALSFIVGGFVGNDETGAGYGVGRGCQ